MKPVMQTMFGIQGNCASACAASILELELDQVPNFAELHEDDAKMWYAYCDWLKEQGYAVILIRGECIEKINQGRPIVPHQPIFNESFDLDGWDDQYIVLGGVSPRNKKLGHACVGRFISSGTGLEMVHDPNPDQTGLVKLENIEIYIPCDSIVYKGGEK